MPRWEAGACRMDGTTQRPEDGDVSSMWEEQASAVDVAEWDRCVMGEGVTEADKGRSPRGPKWYIHPLGGLGRG